MVSKEKIVEYAKGLGFVDAGFTGVEPFDSQVEFLKNPDAHYEWTKDMDLDLLNSVDPKAVMADAEGIIVLLHSYDQSSIPPLLSGHFGRCYMYDDRIIKEGLTLRIREFRDFLKDNGINSKFSPSMPDKLSAARAGVGTFGKNCLFYASRSAEKSSFVFIVTLVVDRKFEPDTPSIRTECPDWCRNACIAACPTRALSGKGTIDSQRCISYLTYHGNELTPVELREQMGMYIYGCDRCQNVCPRNHAHLSVIRPQEERLDEMTEVFSPEKLLAMDSDYFNDRIWPRMFYMKDDKLWKWKMNAARAMGNSTDIKYVPSLIRALREESDERVRAMAAWSLGKLGGAEAEAALKSQDSESSGMVLNEVKNALVMLQGGAGTL